MFLRLIDPLVATFNETRAPTSRKDEAEQGAVMPNWSKTFQTFWSHSSVFSLEKQPKNLNFQSFLPLKDPLVATFNETRAPTSRKYVAEQGIVMYICVCVCVCVCVLCVCVCVRVCVFTDNFNFHFSFTDNFRVNWKQEYSLINKNLLH